MPTRGIATAYRGSISDEKMAGVVKYLEKARETIPPSVLTSDELLLALLLVSLDENL